MRLDRTVSEIAKLLEGQVEGPSSEKGSAVLDGSSGLERLRALDRAGASDLAPVFGRKHEPRARASDAGCLLVGEASELRGDCGKTLIVVPEAEVALDALVAQLGPSDPGPEPGVHPAAVVEDGATLGSDVAIGPGVVVRRGAHIGAGSVLWGNVYIGVDAVVGDSCVLYPGVYLGARCRLGERVILHAHCSLGADGFGFRQDAQGRQVKSPQVGAIQIGDDVELGAHVTVDRGRFEDTVIGRGSKLDDQVHVAHNVRIGEHTVIAGCSTFAGGATIGNHVMIGGCSAVGEGGKMQDHSVLGGMSLLLCEAKSGRMYMGSPAVSRKQWHAQVYVLKRLGRQRLAQRNSEDHRGA